LNDRETHAIGPDTEARNERLLQSWNQLCSLAEPEVRLMNSVVNTTIVVALGIICGTVARIAAVQPARTTWTGIYTDAQAKRGQAVYEEQCQTCHSPDLKGADQAPPLAGADFNADWNDLSMGDLFERVSMTMPADKPGTLKPEQVADVLAFVLSKGGFPAGEMELPAQSEALKEIKYLTRQP
jgi:mono/diheme cytochrome c family protein